MGDFNLSGLANHHAAHWNLFKETTATETNFSNFNAFYSRIFKGQFLVHKNHFRIQRATLYRKDQLKIAALIFLPRPGWTGPAGMAGFAVAHDASNETIHEFWRLIKSEYKGIKMIMPYWGHHYLGFSLPQKPYVPKKIGFMTSAGNARVEELFESQYQIKKYRQYYSLETLVTSEWMQNLKAELQQQPSQFHIRPFNMWKAQEDMSKMNQLVNQCFTEHHDFCPLTDEENWDIMKWSLCLKQKGTFLFLMDGDKEIGFAFGSMDYNQILKGRNDFLNFNRSLFLRRRMSRARLIHIGLLKAYRGQKLVKYLRHQLLLNFHELGADFIENSFIDEGNQASLGNAQSTGALPLHTFVTYQL